MLDGHESQFEYDLMAATGRCIPEFLALGKDGVIALAHFASNLPADSATIAHESGYKDVSEWGMRFKTNALLADIYDAISAFSWSWGNSKTKRKLKKPKPYPRPWANKGRKFGKDPIPVKRFWGWWSSKGGE